MPQNTNLNISPYYDDFESTKNYYKVLWKPEYPVQARELNTVQSILQNQIEQFGNHVFKEGSVVIPGQLNYNNQLFCVKIENQYLGVPVSYYINSLIGKTIKGRDTKLRAKIIYVLNENELENEYITLYISYLNSGINDEPVFSNGEVLTLEDTISVENVIIQAGEGFSNVISFNSTAVGSGVILSSGVYFARGTFVNVTDQILILDPYGNTPSYKVGFEVIESIITSDNDPTLYDNAQGFSNYAAPGADRLKIELKLVKRDIDNTNNENYIDILEVRDGSLIYTKTRPDYNILQDELARRTSDESGDYYVVPFSVDVRESLNNNLGNNGIFNKNQVTYNNNVPSEDLGVYTLSPGKAYVSGYEIDIPSQIFLDFKKPRETKTLTNQSINYYTGSTYILNRVYGSPTLSLENPYVVSLRSDRKGVSETTAAGKEIGLARVYDYSLESGSYNTNNSAANEWNISLYDVQTYTELSLNQPVTLSTPVRIKGEFSGATGYLRYNVSNSGIVTAYNINGQFSIGEKLDFNGEPIPNRIVTSIVSYNNKDVKSISSLTESGITFNCDVKPEVKFTVGFASITSASSGISTVIINENNNFVFTLVTKNGDLISYTKPGESIPTYSTVQQVYDKSLVISPSTTVAGICTGALPVSNINILDLSILKSNLNNSIDNTLYTVLPKKSIADVNLSEANITIRKEFSVNISSNQTSQINAEQNETFLPFDEERYSLIRSDGRYEILTEEKFQFTNGSNGLTIVGLGTTDNGAKLIATLRKSKIKQKNKNRNRVNTIIIDKSRKAFSGIGSTSINDGLTYGNYPYGTRVQDREICLLNPDVTKIYAVVESSNTNDPILPSIVLSSLNGPNNKTTDLIIGETFIGNSSGAVGIYLKRINDLKIEFIYLNDKTLQENETIEFYESGLIGNVQQLILGDKNITNDYIFDNGQRDTIYDYSKLIRKDKAQEPLRKLRIVFEVASCSSSDTGDITTVNSYKQFDYCDIPDVVENVKSSDIIDIRPKVSNYNVTANVTRSPFEFLGRNFSVSNGSARNILVSDESILVDYSFYLPRIDSIFLTKTGTFQLNTGYSAESPQPPKALTSAMEVATIYLPPYLCTMDDVKINLPSHKRYQMKDIGKLDQRITNIEKVTVLNLLEANTERLSIKDNNGLDRFKSGFFVDNFTSISNQNPTSVYKNSIDYKNQELRPSVYTTAIDLELGSKSRLGIGQTSNPNVDRRYFTDIIGTNTKRTGQLITLDYISVVHANQPFATRVENVTPYLVTKYNGIIDLNPSSDTWVDQARIDARTIQVDNFSQRRNELVASGWDPQTGFSPVNWGAWETTWTGVDVSTIGGPGGIIVSTTRTGTERRTGSNLRLEEEISTVTLGDSIVSTSQISFMRSRNIEFIGNRFKPYTTLYCFFDGQDVNRFIVPKLIEITMISGVFEVGETVVQLNNGILFTTGQTNTNIKFRVANANHRSGPYNAPVSAYGLNPYNPEASLTLPSTYSSTSTILNVDTFSLSERANGDYFGYLIPNKVLYGLKSGAQAIINNIRLVTDNVGQVIGSFFIPIPNVPTNPIFRTGTKIFKLTSSSINTPINSTNITSGEREYTSRGTLNSVQSTIVSTRNAVIRAGETLTQVRNVSDTSISIFLVRRDPLAQSFYVEEANGVFITQVDIYFQSKDNQLPVTIQLRSMSNGVPTTDVYPFSEVTVNPSEINISNDATIKTTITFPSPVYLQGEKEHALVILSDSTEYNVWISRLGETDITSLSLPESQQVIVTQQVLLGSLFKSQNASTWDASQYEDLKFTIYKAKFNNPIGNVNFYNPDLDFGNDQIANLVENPLSFNSRKVRIKLNTTINDNNFVIGNTVTQQNSNSTGICVGIAGSATGTLNILNSGIGYKNGTFSNVPLINVNGNGANATVNLIISSGSVVSSGATISNGGQGYEIGDVFTIDNATLGSDSFGRNLRLSLADITGNNEIIVDNVQGDYKIGSANTITYYNGTNLVPLNNYPQYLDVYSELNDGLHIKVNHKNHGMYSKSNFVEISDVETDTPPVKLSQNYSNATLTSIQVISTSSENLSLYTKFEGLPVSANNPGYILIQKEIISYSSISINANVATLTGITRGIDQTRPFAYNSGEYVYKYEINGISLRRINKTHYLGDSNISRSIDLDFYYIKIDTTSGSKGSISANGPNGLIDRSEGVINPKLYIKESKSTGGYNILASQNIQYNLLRPITQSINLTGTSLSASVRTVSGTSVDGDESSFLDLGFTPLNLGVNNYFDSPRIITSKINQTQYLSLLPGYKSLTVNFKLSTSDENISPVIDVDRVALVCVSNRINNAIIAESNNSTKDPYATDPRVSNLDSDPSAFVYATRTISLEVPASSIKVIVGAYINKKSDIRAFYSIMKSQNETPIYYPFPGYDNSTSVGVPISLENSNGKEDYYIQKTDIYGFRSDDVTFKDYEFTIDNLPNFRYFSIKLTNTSTNSSYPPRIVDFRTLALA